MNRQAFIKEVEKRFRRIFLSEESGSVPSVEQTSELQGFVKAGVFLGLVKLEEMHELMESTHVAVFGQTTEERKLAEPGSWAAKNIDYSMYDLPTFIRAGDSPGHIAEEN